MRLFAWFVIVILLLSSTSCEKKKMIMSEKKMENVLFDYHIAEGILRFEHADTTAEKLYYDAVFEKHNITKEVFDSSMIYYMKHADKLHTIYEHLSDRFTNEGRLQGVESNNLTTSYSLEGDTANIWTLESEKVLTPFVPDNLIKYYIKADSTFHPGDKFTLSFRSGFIHQEGEYNGFAAFSVRFTNDSVITRSKKVSTNNASALEVNDFERIGVKEIRGYFLQRMPSTKSDDGSATLRLMDLSDIKLIKTHTEEPDNFGKESKDVTADTLEVKQDSINKEPKTNIEKNDSDEKIKPTPASMDAKLSD